MGFVTEIVFHIELKITGSLFSLNECRVCYDDINV